MTRISNRIHIHRPVEDVYDYVTTPGNWPHWHPSSLAVSGASDHSLAADLEPPQRWVIKGQIVGRANGGTVSYRLAPEDGGTRFEREFVYPTPGLVFALLNRLLLQRRVQRESDEAVRRLKTVLENGRPDQQGAGV